MTVRVENSAEPSFLDGALVVFAQKGFDSCSIDHLCDELGADAADVTQAYGSISGVFQAIYDQIAAAGLLRLIEAMMTSGSPSDRIDQSARAMVNYLLEDTDRAYFFCVEAPRVRGEFAEHRYALLGDYVEALASGTRLMGDVDLTDTQLRIGARAILATAETVVGERLRSPDVVSKRDVIRTLSLICRRVAGVSDKFG